MDEQATVATFVREQDLEAPPAFRLLDLVSEVGELAKEANTSTGYGANPGELDIEPDEIGDVLFATLALAERLEIDAGTALETALEKYRYRLDTGETPGSDDGNPGPH